MDLLKELDKDFRYALYHTKNSQILIVFYKSNEYLSEDSITPIESLYESVVFKTYDIIPEETLKVTCNENQQTNNEMNQNMANYCKKFSDSKEVRLINASFTHKILFEPKVYKAMVDNCEDIYLELGESGIRIDNGDYRTINKLTIQNGIIYPESTANIYVRELFVLNGEITVASKNNDPHNLNLIISKKANIIYMKLYSSIGFVATAGSKDNENISSAVFMSNCIHIYGNEEPDEFSKERIGLFGFKTVLIGEINIDDTVSHGNIIKGDKLVSFTLNKLTRDISKLKTGSCINLHRVGNVTLNNIVYNIKKISEISKSSSIVRFLKDTDSGMHKTLNITNSHINNPTDIDINLIYIEETTIENVFVTDCTIGDGVSFINKVDDALFLKLVYTNVEIKTKQNITFNNIEKLYLTNTNISTEKNIDIKCSYVTINGGIYNFDSFNIGKKDYITLKLNTKDAELIGKTLNIISDTENSLDGIYFDNDSKIKVNKILVKGFQNNFSGTSFMIKELETYSDKLSTISGSTFFLDNDDLLILINSSLTGKIVFSTDNPDLKVDLIIKDKEKFLQNNSFDIISSSETPIISITTNNVIKAKIINHNSEFIYVNFDNSYDSDSNSKLIFVPMYNKQIDYKPMTNTEKLVTINKVVNDRDNQDIVFEVIKK